MTKISISTLGQQQWNAKVSHPMQSWAWGEIRKSEGKQVFRFMESKAGDVVNVYQMTVHPIPYTNIAIGYIPKSVMPSIETISYLHDFGKKIGLLFIKIEPNSIESINHPNGKFNIISSSHPLFTLWNQVLDISPNDNDLLAKMHPKTRYNIRLAEKKGVTVKELSSDEGYAIFEKLYFDTCKRQQYHGHTKQYHRNIWQHLSQPASINDTPSTHGRGICHPERSRGIPFERDLSTPVTGSRDDDASVGVSTLKENDMFDVSRSLSSHILIAFYQDEPLAVFQLWHFLDTIYYVYGGSSDENKSVMAPNLLMWGAIKLGKKLGCNKLDMWGSLPPNYDPKDPWAGFTKFKQGYGTKFIKYSGSFDLVMNPILYRIYNYIQAIRQKLFL